MIRTLIALSAFAFALPASAQPLTADEQAKIDALVTTTLKDSKVPSAEIAVVRDGKIVLSKAYGVASPTLGAARADMPYQIASNSKQFIAAALLLLEDDGKLDLDDKVSKWVPDISGADTISVRQLLSHTSGLQDFWPQDYDFAAMEKAVTPQGILDRWAKKPLDYAPGTRWQYSNTGYVVAGLIIEKASGMPLMDFLTSRIFAPLGMHPLNIDASNTPAYPAGYHRFALGPVRVAKAPAYGWLYSAGELSMTAADLAKWDIARIDRALLPADDWVEQEQPTLLADATTNGYGLGVSTGMASGRRFINHGGESVGFLSQNTVYPDSRAAIVVLTNADFGGVTDELTGKIADIVLPRGGSAPIAEEARTDDVRALYNAIRTGKLDRSLLTEDLNYYFSPTALGDYRTSLAALGEPTKVEPLGKPRLRGGFVNRNFRITAGGKDLTLITYAEPGAHGRWEQYLIQAD